MGKISTEEIFLKPIHPLPRPLFPLLLALFFLIAVGLETEAFARAGGGKTSGRSATGATRSYQKSPAQTPPAQPGEFQQQRTPSVPPSAAPARGFMSGMGGMIFGGILGALLFRSLGVAGEPEWGKTGFAFGDLILLMIVLTLAFLIFRHFRNRSARPVSAFGPGSFPEPGMAYSSLPNPAPSPPVLTAPALPALDHIRTTDPGFNESEFLSFAGEAFRRVQANWEKRDGNALRSLLSPEMAALFQKEMERLREEKKINRIENIEIRKAEITDALQDRGEDLVTVKLEVRLRDYTVDEKSGQVVAGDSRDPIEFREFWTFSRNIGERIWVLAGISQNSVQ
jgi:predicted lipid-binding transport protein (Tim44 family)